MFKIYKNLYYYIIILFFLFYNITFSAPTICTDGTEFCGMTTNISVVESCSMLGPDLYFGNRILGGQICYTVGGQDSGGYYMIGTSEPESNTIIYPFGSSLPWGWSYVKSSDVLRLFGEPRITSKIFQYDIFNNLKFFNPVEISITLYPPDDSSEVRIGNNSVAYMGCISSYPQVQITDVFKPNYCPSKNLVGSTNFNAQVGDSISFKVTNDLRPNNGYAEWATGKVSIIFKNVTHCRTSAYFDYLCGYPGCSGKPNYIPTAPGVCSPETKPKANLNTYWKDTGTPTKEITIDFGQSIPTQTFVVENNGELNSKLRINSCNPSVGWISILNCPIGTELSFDNFKNSIISFVSNFRVKL